MQNLLFYLNTNREYFFKKLNVNNKLKKDGYYVVRNELNYFFDVCKFEKIETNKYLRKLIFSKEELNKLLLYIFLENNFKQKITDLTGFHYSIDFSLLMKLNQYLRKIKSLHGIQITLTGINLLVIIL